MAQNLASVLQDARDRFNGGARVYEALAKAAGPFTAGNSTQHALYIEACRLVEAAARPKQGKPLPRLNDRKRWAWAFTEAQKNLPTSKEESHGITQK